MKSPLEDTIWGAVYGSVAAVQAAFDRFGPEYHEAILATGAPAGAARALIPHLGRPAQGIDLGCGSGVLGLALKKEGYAAPLDGIDLSPVMLRLAAATGCYRHLHQVDLLGPEKVPGLGLYDFAVSMGLIGDYVPYYLALPYAVSLLRPGGLFGFAVETRSTPWRALEKLAGDLRLELLSETVLEVENAKLVSQRYQFYVGKFVSDGQR
jgi:predicted TPR repeat methyltransferase